MSPTPSLANLQKELSARFFERDAVIEGLLCAMVAGQHVLLVGPPGTGKSELAHELCKRVTGARYFQWLLTRFTTPEELFGPVSLKALEHDRYTRVTDGKLPTAHVAFLDEVFKASSAILNTLLSVMNERVFHDGEKPVNVPLLSLVGATNELPEEDELLALSDRFLLRYEVDYLKEEFLFLRMLSLEDKPAETTLALDDLLALRKQAVNVTVPERVKRDLLELRRTLTEKGIVASDRRYRQALSVVKARALLHGRDACETQDLGILAHVLWREPGEKAEVEAALERLFTGHEEDAQQLLFQAREVAAFAANAQNDADVDPEAAATEALSKLHDLSRRIDLIADAAKERGRASDRVTAARDEVRKMVRALLQGRSPVAEPRH
ncbi:MAG: AAA family ATPase [Deltaproteobacteria bacterium]|nr:AAA family ATPase [Deltaproteobacteria bacterium]